ncbi:sulfotransferase family protein [Micromonospora sp. DT233]|uniref:sulfotransferase family protein n=1 Tax=Micromonospora sp. DT233 TaxID=3393432 RepID=UPI003CF4D138
MANSPVLVLASGQRCGSTLVQRLLSSHPDVLIWGEHAGQLRPLLAAVSRMKVWAEEDGMEARNEFEDGGYQSFMANLTPEVEWIDEALRQFLTTLFADRAAAQGKSIWGIKEVRYGLPEACAMHHLFPGAVVIQLVRDPRDVLRSLDLWERQSQWWNRRKTELAMQDWLRITESFLHSTAEMSPPVLRLRYEDLTADPAMAMKMIGAHTSLDPAKFDPDVFKRKIHITGPNGDSPRTPADWNALPPSLRALLDDDDVRMAAAACGYDL